MIKETYPKKMKIGILTYHSTHNYGAFLQAYALCKSLSENTGHQVEIINFCMNKAVIQNKSIAKGVGRSVLQKKYLRKRYSVFEKSINKYQILSSNVCLFSDSCEEFSKWVEGRYDVIVVGSDEIWKVDGYRGFPTPYWLAGVKCDTKMSYAASSRTEIGVISDENKDKIKEFLKSFNYIGVRDNPTKELVELTSDNKEKIHINCDPTFTFNFRTSKNKGKMLLKKKFDVGGKKKCIALMLNNPTFEKEIIKRYHRDFDIISLFDYHLFGVKGNAVLDPFEWMEAIAGVDGLITDFFHGMVFALKNNTPFISFESRSISDKKYSKAYDLLKRNGLEDHFYMYENAKSQSMKEVGGFLSDVLDGTAQYDFQSVCENEKRLSESFFSQFSDIRPKHIVINNKDDCCGCRACESVCPKQAITMIKSNEGFLYPNVNLDRCIDCGKCKSICTFNNKWGGLFDNCSKRPLGVYGAKHIDEDVRRISRSGGAFTALTDYIMNNNGAVYGVGLNDKFLAIHKRAITKEQRDEFRGSKYIQSDMKDVLGLIRSDIEKGVPVLFSGTPCQVAAVRNLFRNEDQTNMYFVDIVCHGVPSPLVWQDYLDYVEKKHHGQITSVDFRNKKFGWSAHRESYIINGVEYDSYDYTCLFYKHLILRPSCFNCKYKKIIRPSDVTIADYWGIDKAIPGFNDNKGVSLVLTNTSKGEELFEAAKKDLYWKTAKLEDSMQNSLHIGYSQPADYDKFWNYYCKKGIAGCIQKEKHIRYKKIFKRAVTKPFRLSKRILIKIYRRVF